MSALSAKTGDNPAAAVARFLVSGSDVGGDTVGGAAAVRVAERGAIASPGPAGVPSSSGPGLTGLADFAGFGAAGASGAGLGEADSPETLAAAARVLNASAGPGRFQVSMQLEPPELGQLRLHIHMQQQTLALHVDVQSHAVAKLIESRLSDLRDALALQGIHVNRTDVVVRSPASADADPGHNNSQHGGSGMQQSDDQASGNANQFAGDPQGRWTFDGGAEHMAREQAWRQGDGSHQQSPTGSQDLYANDGMGSITTDDSPATELSLDLVA